MTILRSMAGVLLALIAFIGGCGQATLEAKAGQPGDASDDVLAATATVESMLALAEAGDWDAYVDLHYGETHKFSTPDDRVALVWRFEQRWGPKVIKALRRAVTVTPLIDPGGKALFIENGNPVFILYREDDDRWTFHL